MAKFRKKPVVIEAVQFLGDKETTHVIQKWANEYGVTVIDWVNTGLLGIPTPEGSMSATKGDWIIRGVNGEIYPCKPDVFSKSYDLVEE